MHSQVASRYEYVHENELISCLQGYIYQHTVLVSKYEEEKEFRNSM